MTRRVEELRSMGFVLEGQHPDIHSVTVSERGKSKTVDVRPLVAPRADLTVLRPSGGLIGMKPGGEYRLR